MRIQNPLNQHTMCNLLSPYIPKSTHMIQVKKKKKRKNTQTHTYDCFDIITYYFQICNELINQRPQYAFKAYFCDCPSLVYKYLMKSS